MSELDDDGDTGFEDDIDEVSSAEDHEDGSRTIDLAPTRKQNRAARMGDYEDYKKNEALARANEEKIDRLSREQAGFKQEVYNYADSIDTPANDPEDAMEKARDDNAAMWHGLSAAQQNDPDTQKQFKDKANKHDRDLANYRAQRAANQAASNQSNNQQAAYVTQVMRAEYPDVVGNEKVLTYSDGYYKMELAKGRQAGLELMKESADAARRQFKTAPDRSPPPSESRRAAYEGVPRGGQAPPAGRGRITKEQRAMARQVRPDLSPNEAERVWLKRFNSEA
jgi:hypothetical protein